MATWQAERLGSREGILRQKEPERLRAATSPDPLWTCPRQSSNQATPAASQFGNIDPADLTSKEPASVVD